MTENNSEILPYKLAGLLYAPAINISVAQKIINKTYPYLKSVAFCLEDSIMDNALSDAENSLVQMLEFIKENNTGDLPFIFVRIRNPRHLEYVHNLLGDNEDIVTGYILPKFDLSNGMKYKELIVNFNKNRKNKLYIMPILESYMVAYKATRLNVLLEVRDLLNRIKEYVLNIRVGGNDFSNIYGLRRSANQSIYDIGVIRDILVDIINVFASEYIVSAPVWEYFGDNPEDQWAKGLKNELILDRLNGFIGKTAIHPSQLPIIYESMKVNKSDYDDAVEILNWRQNNLGVKKSSDGSRMNEVKCHSKWARHIKIMGDIYGVK
ncbi:MAG: HpcH/HpaI aldolase/citrate lyase family protein [Oscillospiraceae bacterium]|nr:HpcH/HpaI aldolase/citrate lyase family protein [Oscillospiraceae bacterium]